MSPIRLVTAVFFLANSLITVQARDAFLNPTENTVACNPAVSPKRIVSGVEVTQVYDIDYLARVDTGANTSSINAYDIHVENEVKNPNANVGRQLHFTTANENGISKRLDAKIVKVETVRNAQGTETRYVVLLPIRWHDVTKNIEVNLRDRSKMQYSLLLGRNWLKDDFVVDVGRGD